MSQNKFYGKVKKSELLTKEEEVRLSKLKDEGDLDARNKLIANNLRLVMSIANKYRKYNVDFDDLFSEGNIGLMKGIEKYDWKRGFKLSTYATWWINQSIYKFVMENSGSIKTSQYVNAISSKIKNAVKDFSEKFGEAPSASEISDILDIKEDIISSVVNITENKNFINIDDIADVPNKELAREEDIHISNINKKELRKIIESSVDKMEPIEVDIFKMRNGVNLAKKKHEQKK